MRNCYFIIFLISSLCVAQNRETYNLRVMLNELKSFPLTIKNVTTNEIVETDAAGYFKLNIAENDIIGLENNYYELHHRISSNDLAAKTIRLYPKSLSTELHEVQVHTVSSKSLGLDAAEINKYIYKRNPNPNMDFKAMFFWLLDKLSSNKKNDVIKRKPNEPNPYVASLPKSIMTDYLKIPEDFIDDFYVYLSTDYVVDDYIKNNEEDKWRFHLLEQSIRFLELEGIPQQR